MHGWIRCEKSFQKMYTCYFLKSPYSTHCETIPADLVRLGVSKRAVPVSVPGPGPCPGPGWSLLVPGPGQNFGPGAPLAQEGGKNGTK